MVEEVGRRMMKTAEEILEIVNETDFADIVRSVLEGK